MTGLILLIIGLIFAHFYRRPFMDWDFLFVWYGILLLLDRKNIFKDKPTFLSLACASSLFWWFYEWANSFLNNWSYDKILNFYEPMEFSAIAAACFTTVLPLALVTSNLISPKITWSFSQLSKKFAIFIIFIGLAFLCLTIFIPSIFFGLIWWVLFLIFDPINAFVGKRSLIVQLTKRNFRPLIYLALAALLSGFLWETVNHFVPKWTYPIAPWFWNLPWFFTIKYIEMPLAGFLGYIPFYWSAFAFLEFLDLKIKFFQHETID